jgi:hypothetical protein
MVEEFLKSVVKGVEELGWASAKRIAEHTDWDPEIIQQVLDKLVEDKRILCRKKGRGHQYGSLNPVTKFHNTKLEERTEDISPSSIYSAPSVSTVFDSLDEFMLSGIYSLPKDRSFGADDFATELIRSYPDISWSKEEIKSRIGMLVRLGRLDYRPFLDESRMKYEYIVK